ncbi:MAG: hypothetical protein P0Y49_09245 [Candidatus Pedobacter colombiensis]|uniref:Uncharacterized protein n=1 Tax=Candidatus Pedobacter colombiensis TaxID=3121371 RepID=A0AAJ5WD34_9SPHI|nr:hypothetical protein [Pedobacter sp.]WEK21325.1 MAG: hypothetical protein P0Y49_09245 [Pedobacter sp.]
MERKTFSPERLMHIRRLRKARRLYKKIPLFAYYQMLQEYPGYALSEFWEDLRIRRKPKPKSKKSNAIKYGRYWRIQKLLKAYGDTGDINLMVQAKKLQERIAKPYQVFVKLGRECYEFSFSCYIPLEKIEMLTKQFRACKTVEEIDTVNKQFIASIPIY